MYKLQNKTIESFCREYTDEPFHAILCDPPYGLEFMGKEWDTPSKNTMFPRRGDIGGFADGNKPSFKRQGKIGKRYREWAEGWALGLRKVLCPGALVMCFGGTRTWHNLACGVEEAGFEVWDTVMWVYGQGMPKGQAIKARGFEGWRTAALKPAWEPVICFRAPGIGGGSELASIYGCGALNVEGGRIRTADTLKAGSGGLFSHIRDGKPYPGGRSGDKSASRRYQNKGGTNFAVKPGPRGGDARGRYPANLVIDGVAAGILDVQSGELMTGRLEPWHTDRGKIKNTYGTYRGRAIPKEGYGGDSGGASRFFYCAKVTRRERDAGVKGELRSLLWSSGEQNPGSFQSPGTVRAAKNNHPTVKPIDLCRWLATLLLPPEVAKPRRLLVPFAGTGSEMIGALGAGWDEVVGVEQDADYCRIAEQRISYWMKR